MVYQVLCALGEVASWSPADTTAEAHAFRYCDPALGFTLGWIYWLKYIVVIPNQLTAGAMVISYWLDAKIVNPGVWITAFLVIILTCNYWGGWHISEYEFCLSAFKTMVILGLMVLSLVLALGGGPGQDGRKGFRYWKDPGAFAGDIDSTLGKFYAVCRTMQSATFAYLGSELVGMNIVQTQNPRKTTRRAVNLTFRRIFVFHVTSVILIGMLVPYNSKHLAGATTLPRSAAAPAFVVAIDLANIRSLPSILNACILLFVVSSANYSLNRATRALYLLSRNKHAPAILSRVDRRGVPICALGLCSALAGLAYMNISSDSRVLFGYFVNLVSMFGILAWISILVTHIAFVQARKAQGVPDEALAFRAPFGRLGSLITLMCCVFVSLMRCFDLFDRPSRFDYQAFVTSYVGIPLYLALVVGYKFATWSSASTPKADMWADKAQFDQSEQNTTAAGLIVEDNARSRRHRWKERFIGAWLL
ncbi:Amino acid permease [Aspergillus sp. HF37]|nr:Amino acid permease [Aspergillus sp. HF37]